MAKYPLLEYRIINKCIKKIKASVFDTYLFIKTLEKINPDYIRSFSGIGVGWKSVIGRNLSKYATNTQNIKSKGRKGNAELWIKR